MSLAKALRSSQLQTYRLNFKKLSLEKKSFSALCIKHLPQVLEVEYLDTRESEHHSTDVLHRLISLED